MTKLFFKYKHCLQTSEPGVPLSSVSFFQYKKKELCVFETLMEYLDRTKDIRKCSDLFISYKTYNKVTTCTLARWLKTVLSSSGIDSTMYTAHSFRGTAAPVAFSSGVSLKDIMDTINYSAKNILSVLPYLASQ